MIGQIVTEIAKCQQVGKDSFLCCHVVAIRDYWVFAFTVFQLIDTLLDTGAVRRVDVTFSAAKGDPCGITCMN